MAIKQISVFLENKEGRINLILIKIFQDKNFFGSNLNLLIIFQKKKMEVVVKD